MWGELFPKKVQIREVCPRDGFQSINEWVATEDKIKLVDAMAETGISIMEVTSFVSPKAIPQMKDASAVMAHFNDKWKGKIESMVLIPNLKGAEMALAVGADCLNFVVSASEAHNKANTRRTVRESMDELKKVADLRGDVDLGVSVATSFECPFDGPVDPEKVIRIIEEALEIGANSITMADTIGTCDPARLTDTLLKVRSHFPDYPFFLHLHDTHGMAMVNSLAAMELGFYRFDTAAGGLGGCPFAPGAAGNVATEDMVNLFNRIGVETGVSLEKVLSVAKVMKDMGLPVNSHMAASKAGCCCEESEK